MNETGPIAEAFALLNGAPIDDSFFLEASGSPEGYRQLRPGGVISFGLLGAASTAPYIHFIRQNAGSILVLQKDALKRYEETGLLLTFEIGANPGEGPVTTANGTTHPIQVSDNNYRAQMCDRHLTVMFSTEAGNMVLYSDHSIAGSQLMVPALNQQLKVQLREILARAGIEL